MSKKEVWEVLVFAATYAVTFLVGVLFERFVVAPEGVSGLMVWIAGVLLLVIWMVGLAFLLGATAEDQ